MAKNYALVTGGSSGLGLEIARLLAQRGYKLLLVSDQSGRLEKLRTELSTEYNVDVQVYAMDLAQETAANEVFELCKERKWVIDVLINNAGFFFYGPAVDSDPVQGKKMVLLHVLTTTLLSTLFGNMMKQYGSGYILNVASMSAAKPFPMIAHYGSSKAYLRYFTRSLRTELKPYGVKVSCLSPGAIATSLFDNNSIDVVRATKYGVMMTAEKVATKAVSGLFAGKALIMPGTRTKLFTLFSILTPHWIIQLVYNRTVKRSTLD